MYAQVCLDQLNSKIFETPINQEKCKLLSYFLLMDIYPEDLQINGIFSRLCQGMLKVL